MGIEDNARDEDRCKQIGQQADGERDREALHRPGAEDEQKGRRDDGGDVRINDGDPGVGKALIDGRRGRLAGANLLADALEDQHIRVHAHADGENDAGDARQGQGERQAPTA